MRLEGLRVYLRPMAREDIDWILRWRGDPAVASQLFSERPPTREEHDKWFVGLQQRDDRVEFVIVVRDGERPVGTIGLSRIDRAGGEADYGIMIGEAAWRGRGIAREASELILSYAFETLGLQTVTLSLFADNDLARALYTHLDFVEDPACPGEREKDGQRRKTMTMRLSREKWMRRD